MPELDWLSPRRRTILRIIVDDYIEKASPVGSDHIARGHRLGVSPATIRNDMAALEEEGYITHPHTSAGRVPSDKGYRYFVEDLMAEAALPLDIQEYVLQHLPPLEGELEEWTRLAADLLARVARTMALITVPRAPAARFKHLELVLLQEFIVLLVLVLRESKVKRQLLRLQQAVSQEDLSTLAHQLSAVFDGLSTAEVMPASGSEPSSEPAIETEVTRAVVRLMAAEDARSSEELYLEGLRNLLPQPEFGSAERLRVLMDVLDEPASLGALVSGFSRQRDLSVVIGAENPLEELREFSMVIAPYGVRGGLTGAIGVMGPTRLRYARAISSVRFLSSVMTGLVQQNYT